MKTFFTILFTLSTIVVNAQSKSPFDTLQVDFAELQSLHIEVSSSQAEAIKVMNLNTKNYVISVYAEEKPGSLIFDGRLKDIQRHRDYKLAKILSEEQFIAYRTAEIMADPTVELLNDK